MKKKPVISPEVRKLLHGQLPNKKDIEYITTHMQRHTRGIDAWWEDNALALGPQRIIRVILTLWEAGRLKKIGL